MSIRLMIKDTLTGIGIAVAVFGIGASTSFATDAIMSGHTDPTRNTGNTEIARVLKLTPQQAASVQTLIDAERKAMHEMRESMRLNGDAIQSGTRQKLAKMLNAEQLGRYDEWKQANRPPRPNADRDRPPPPSQDAGQASTPPPAARRQ